MATTVTVKHNDGATESFEVQGFFFDAGYLILVVDKYTVKVKDLKSICELSATPDPRNPEAELTELSEDIDEVTKNILDKFKLSKDTDPGTKH